MHVGLRRDLGDSRSVRLRFERALHGGVNRFPRPGGTTTVPSITRALHSLDQIRVHSYRSHRP